MEDIAAKGHFIQLGFAFCVREGEIRDGRILGRNHVHGSETDRFVGKRVHEGGLDFTHPALKKIVIENNYLGTGRNAARKGQNDY